MSHKDFIMAREEGRARAVIDERLAASLYGSSLMPRKIRSVYFLLNSLYWIIFLGMMICIFTENYRVFIYLSLALLIDGGITNRLNLYLGKKLVIKRVLENPEFFEMMTNTGAVRIETVDCS